MKFASRDAVAELTNRTTLTVSRSFCVNCGNGGTCAISVLLSIKSVAPLMDCVRCASRKPSSGLSLISTSELLVKFSPLTVSKRKPPASTCCVQKGIVESESAVHRTALSAGCAIGLQSGLLPLHIALIFIGAAGGVACVKVHPRAKFPEAPL